MGVASESLLVGREAEVERLDRLFTSLEQGTAAALICGVAGIGKTSVWRAAGARAEAGEVRLLRTRCAEVEMPIAFGALADLFEAASDEVAEGLSGPQRRALTAAFGRGGEEERTDWLVLAEAVLASLRKLAAHGPLLLAIDDLQWLDPGSRRTLAWALRRSGAAPVGLLATLRDGWKDRDPLALADTLPPDRSVTVELAPLSAGALQHLIAVRVGVHLPRPTLTRVQRASGGNPLFALEFARGLAAAGENARAPAPLAVPASLDQLMRTRVAALPKRLRHLLEVAAALERPMLPLLDRALDGGATEALVEDAMRAEVLVQDEDGAVRFTHPLLASAVYFGITPPRRRALHQRLAELVDGAEERGRHAALAAAKPDAAVATLLEVAAAAAATRGGLDAAAELAGEAVRLTPPTEAAAHLRRVFAAAGWLVETGEFAAARAKLDSLLADELPAKLRTEALLLRAECEFVDRGLLVALLQEAQEVAEEPQQRWQALLRLAHHGGWVSGDAAMAADTARMALEVALDLDEAPLVEASAAALAFYQSARGRPDDVPATVRGRRAVRLPHMQWWQLSPAVSLGCRLMWTGDLVRARDLLKNEYEAHDRAGREAKGGYVRCWLSELEWRAGEWPSAETLAREATERLGDVNPTAFPRALLAASTGSTEEAISIAAGALAWAATNEERVAPPRFHWLLGLLELSRGDGGRAHAPLTEAQALLDAAGIREPGYLPLLPDLIESLVACGRLDEADEMLAGFDALAAALSHRWAIPAAQRSRAQLLLASRDADAAATLATTAANGFAAIGHPLDRGRALLVAGNAQRRLGQRRRATQPLTEATQIFARLGAPLWLQQAEDELRRANPRPHGDRDRLTAAESRVATLVAAGRKNKEVAAELYTTVATVEAHLTRIYRKLGIRSRSELARHASGETLHPDQQ